jgi:hypothetical protein
MSWISAVLSSCRQSPGFTAYANVLNFRKLYVAVTNVLNFRKLYVAVTNVLNFRKFYVLAINGKILIFDSNIYRGITAGSFLCDNNGLSSSPSSSRRRGRLHPVNDSVP